MIDYLLVLPEPYSQYILIFNLISYMIDFCSFQNKTQIKILAAGLNQTRSQILKHVRTDVWKTNFYFKYFW